jgi:formate hydrogenlyase subunit 6/NADH:ubiquinone oxidoreductase subunit I
MAKKHGFSTRFAKDAFSTIFKKRATQKYPSVPASVAEGFRGKQVMDFDKCIGCTLCSKECPTGAIEIVEVQGKKRPLIHLDKCVFCYQCADTCPKGVFQTSKDFELAVIDKSTLVIKPTAPPIPAQSAPSTSCPTVPN